MVEKKSFLYYLNHFIIIAGIGVIMFPLWITFVAASHDAARLAHVPLPMMPGGHFFENLKLALVNGVGNAKEQSVGFMLFNSLIMALMIAAGKISISIISAFAVVYFEFRFRMFFFWMIFITLMLPVEVRILPTYEVVANLGMLNTYAGLSVPLIASATATFMFRQVFLTIPDEMLEAARIDGAGPLRFFWDILLPLSKTNIAALFVILFIYGWNQYLWPLLVTTDTDMYTIVMGIKQMLEAVEEAPEWHLIMMTALLAQLPPVAVVLSMQNLFVKGLIETEK